jgi:hypothetical protein
MYLREFVMGRELFDFAFKEYARRWKFKRPTPADFFRTMEDASGVDLDWFWRGWFYGTDHLDVAITDIREYRVSSMDPDKESPLERQEFHRDAPEAAVTKHNREESRKTRVQRFPELKDMYNEKDKFTVSNENRNDYKSAVEGLEYWEKEVLERAIKDNHYVYFIDFENLGGLVTPLALTFEYASGKSESVKLPVEIWRRDANTVSKLWVSKEKISSLEIDRNHDTPDADRRNDRFPRKIIPSRIELYKGDEKERDLMAEMLVELKGNKKGADNDCDCKSVPLESSN